MALSPKRYALISSDREAIAVYLPVNYRVVARGTRYTVIEGRDEGGWTLHDYVLPRLASGLYFGQEIGLDHPVMKMITEAVRVDEGM